MTKPNGNTMRNFFNQMAQAVLRKHRAEFDQGRLFDEAMTGSYWQFWPFPKADGKEAEGYPSFDRWCRDLFGHTGRKAHSLRTNYLKIDAIQLDENGPTFSRLLRIGWTKVEQVLRAARTETDVLGWLDHIENGRLSFQQIRGEVDASISGYERPTDTESLPPISDDDNEEDDTDSLDIRQRLQQKRDRRGKLTRTGKVRIPYKLSFSKRDSHDIFARAVEHIQGETGGSVSEAVALMATSHLANAAKEDEGGPAVTLEYMIRAIEHTYGVSLAVVSPQEA